MTSSLLAATLTGSVRRDLPSIAPRIEHRRPSIAVGRVHWVLDRSGPGIDREAVSLIRVFDIHAKEGRHGLAPASAVADHYYGVADLYFSRPSLAIFAAGIEHGPEKSDQPGDVGGEDSRRDRMPAGRSEAAHLLARGA